MKPPQKKTWLAILQAVAAVSAILAEILVPIVSNKDTEEEPQSKDNEKTGNKS